MFIVFVQVFAALADTAVMGWLPVVPVHSTSTSPATGALAVWSARERRSP